MKIELFFLAVVFSSTFCRIPYSHEKRKIQLLDYLRLKMKIGWSFDLDGRLGSILFFLDPDLDLVWSAGYLSAGS